MRFAVLFALLCLASALAACNAAAGAPSPATAITASPVITTRLTVSGSTTIQPLAEKLAERYHTTTPQIELKIAGGGSVVGINAVQEGRVDIGMASRALKPEEADGIKAVQVATDVLAVVVHRDNPLANLSLAQLKGIFSGTITNWREVGGPDMAILPVIREVSSGTRGAFDEIALRGEKPSLAADVQVTASEVERKVAETPNAIGYVGFGNLKQDVKILEIAGVAPSADTARSGSYPLIRPLLLLLGPLSRPEAELFVRFVLSADGQGIVAANGWVTVRPLFLKQS